MGWLLGQSDEEVHIDYGNLTGNDTLRYSIKFRFHADKKMSFNEVKEKVYNDFETKINSFMDRVRTCSDYIPDVKFYVSLTEYRAMEDYTYASGYINVIVECAGRIKLVVGTYRL